MRNFDHEDREILRLDLLKALGHLEELDQKILCLRFGLVDEIPRTWAQIEEELGIASSSARLRVRKVLPKLKGLFVDQKAKSLLGRRARGPSCSWVYFIQSDGPDGPIKIGVSMSVKGRMRDLQVANPKPLRLIGKMPGSSRDERKIHRQFKHLHIRGEWFRPGNDLLIFVHQNKGLRRRPNAKKLSVVQQEKVAAENLASLWLDH